MSLSEIISSYNEYLIMGLAGLSLLLLIFIIILSVKQGKLNKKYKKFMTGGTGENLEEQIIARFADIDQLKSDTKFLSEELTKVKENLQVTYQKVGVVKYDAFKEMGGKLSFVLALLDKNNSGILLNSVHSSREGCYTYLKEIIKGESFLELSEDEKKALNQALSSTNFME
ncbi:MAG: putative rane protein [Firmicutes bacterium]|nr:putative rane protein [Bacillota bacterium]